MEFSPVWWHWMVVGFALMLLELALPAFFAIWFGFGAIIVGVLLLVMPAMAFSIQLLLFTVASVIMTAVWFRFFRADRQRSQPGTGGDEQLLGEFGVISRAVRPGHPGLVRFQRPVLGADSWNCISDEPLVEGNRVKVLAVEGSSVRVGPAHADRSGS